MSARSKRPRPSRRSSGGVRYPARTTNYREIRASIYVQDPMDSSAGIDGLTTIRLPGEPYLDPGPRTGRVEVVDQDFVTGVLHPPARPLSNREGFAVNRGSHESRMQFHQVNVWAIITRTLEILENPKVFGRPIPWQFPGGRLLVHPHAFPSRDAYYDRSTRALHFGYFEARKKTIQSCLSHDIVTHELGHAVLDGLKPLYDEVESPDQAGFHEYFGDALAMSSALTMREVVKEVVKKKPRSLSASNLVSDIALEFGSRGEQGGRPLRSAANRRHMRDLRHNWEEHDYSEVLSGAYYDLLRRLYPLAVRQHRDWRGTSRVNGQVVVGALFGAASRTTRMMLRALDYCPPAGLTYRDYARAVLRADEVAYPVDSLGYRKIMLDVFLRRGLLRSEADGRPDRRIVNSQLRGYDVDQLSATRSDAYAFLDANRDLLSIPYDVNFQVLSLYRTRKVSAERFYLPREVVIEFGWPHPVGLPGRAFAKVENVGTLWCGGTIVFNADGNVLHYVVKLPTPERLRRYRQYIAYAIRRGDFDDRFQVVQTATGSTIVRVPAGRHIGRKG